MWKRVSKSTILILGVIVMATDAQEEKRWAVLPHGNDTTLEGWYSASHVTKFWNPTTSDLDKLEVSLHKVTDLSIESENSIEQIEHPEQYLRQYLPVVQDGKKRIFIFAFCDLPKEGVPAYWRKRRFVFLDSDRATWSAFFDIESGSFLNLQFHGRCPHYF